jgi:DNA-binding CsgD family transcriptional regulator
MTQAETCPSAARSIRLTPRQGEILTLVAQGATDNEIACRLYVSSGYVSNQMKKIRRRLGACSRAHAVAVALGLGILDAPPSKQENT